MAVITQRAGAKETVRQKREREQELLVWPDLVFVEFICAVLFTVAFVLLSVMFNAPLLNKANPSITPDPSKAPWYFMNLQELLLHMDKGLAGVIVPTILLVALMMVPYVDRSNEGQGGWFATPNAIRIALFSFAYTGFWLTWTILWDDGAHVRVYERLPKLWFSDNRLEWPGNKGKLFWEDWPGGDFVRVFYDFIFLNNRVAVRDTWNWSLPVPFQPGNGTDGHLDWPRDFKEVPLPLNGTWIWHWSDPQDSWMPAWLRRIAYPYNGHLDIPAITAEYVLPCIMMIGLPILLIVMLRKMGWAHTVRDGMIALFTGFIVVYVGLTTIGVAFRGESQQLVPPTRVPNLEEYPQYRHYVPPPDTPLVIIDTRTGMPLHG
jgi:quinol---cytochrome c reductase cytochrome c subunit, bacillus type